MVADARARGRPRARDRREGRVGSRATDAGHLEPARTHHGQRRPAVPGEPARRQQQAGDRLSALGLVRRRALLGLVMRLGHPLNVLALALVLIAAALRGSAVRADTPQPGSRPHTLFKTSDNCLACHNGLTLATGEDVSIGSSWRSTMMANSARDPYWQASVRRETIDHPQAAIEIEDECAVCHMPMARTQAVENGGKGRVFAHLPIGDRDSDEARL